MAGLDSIRDTYLVYGSPLLEADEKSEVAAVMDSGWLGTGPRVAQFQEEFRRYVGAEYALAFNSCTAGLHLALLAIGVGPGDEVITTSMTFCATVNTIIHCGARPVLVDVDPATMNIDPRAIEAAVTERTKAVVPVHFAGRPCDMEAIASISRKHGLRIINDAAHAIETEYGGAKIGAGLYGDLTAYSFYATKNVVTGEGGMVTTNDSQLADKMKVYGLHGMSKDAWKRFSDDGYKHYQVVLPGYKYNMMDLQAAIGLHQLRRIEAYSMRRLEIWNAYNQAFVDLPVTVPAPPEPDTRHAYHLYTILVDIDQGFERDAVIRELHRQNIGVGVHYVAIHLHPYYQEAFGYRRGDFPHAEFISDRTISLPLSAKLSDEDVEDVIRAVRRVFVPKG